jgi:hypothetical protein
LMRRVAVVLTHGRSGQPFGLAAYPESMGSFLIRPTSTCIERASDAFPSCPAHGRIKSGHMGEPSTTCRCRVLHGRGCRPKPAHGLDPWVGMTVYRHGRQSKWTPAGSIVHPESAGFRGHRAQGWSGGARQSRRSPDSEGSWVRIMPSWRDLTGSERPGGRASMDGFHRSLMTEPGIGRIRPGAERPHLGHMPLDFSNRSTQLGGRALSAVSGRAIDKDTQNPS